MRILLHICCGPCAVFPLQRLRAEGHEVHGLFYNPNIHPYQEFCRSIDALKGLSRQTGLTVAIDEEYGLRDYLRRVVFQEESRCRSCYDMRLERLASEAKKNDYDAFTSTLLYSKYQQHAVICERSEWWAQQYQVGFYYEDFRAGWQTGIDEAIERQLYRQPYCGCIYSEQERYDKSLRKKKQKGLDTVQEDFQRE